MKKNNINGFTIIELISVILILSIISLIGLAVKVNLDQSTKDAYYESLEGTVSMAGQNYFSDNIDEKPSDTDYASVIEINSRNNTIAKNLRDKAYISKVFDIKRNECPGKVISYMNVDRDYSYITCLECGDDYNSGSKNRVCSYCVNNNIEVETDDSGETFTTCKLEEIPVVNSLAVTYIDNGQTYKAYGAESETYTYDDAIWTSRSLRVTYTTTYQYAKKLRIVDEAGQMVDTMSCDLTGTTTKTCSKDITVTTYGKFYAYVVDDLNRISSTGVKEFFIKLDKTTPVITMTAYNNIGQVYTSGTSTRNLDLELSLNIPMAPSGYTYKWYYSTDLTNGTNKVMITQVNLKPNGEFVVQIPAPTGEDIESGDQSDEITNVDTNLSYRLDKDDMSLYVNAARLVTLSRKYIIEITTGAGLTGTTNKNVTISRPAAKVSLTAKKSSSGTSISSNAWSNEDVSLTASISNPSYGVIRWSKTNISTGVKTNIQGNFDTYKVTSVSTNLGDKYTATVALSDNTDEEESEEFIVKIDKTDPKCGSVSGSSTSWTSSSRTISVKCSDTNSGCTASSTSKSFSSSTKTSSITIKDKAGNSKSCSVNVYVDKGSPSVSISGSCQSTSCVVSVSGSDSYSGVSYKKYCRSSSRCTPSTTYSGSISSMNQYVCAYAVDKVGNKSSTSCEMW